MSLRETLEAKFDEMEQAETPPPEPVEAAPEPAPVEEAPEAVEAREPAPARERDASGKFVKGEGKKPPPSTMAELKAQYDRQPKPPALPTQEAAKPVGVKPAVPVRAPQSWKPAVREQYAALPPEVRSEIDRREREHQKTLQENAQLRQSSQTGSPYEAALRPYEAIVRASGMQPHDYIGNVMQQVHALTYGPPHVKADILANLVMQFGPDLLRADQQDGQGGATSALERALVAKMRGGPPRMQPPPQQPQEFRDPRLDQLLRQRDQEIQRTNAERLERMANDPQFEFFEDVSEGMEQVLRFWASKGKTTLSDSDLQKAYDWACRENPDVAAVYEQRKEAERARKALASTEQARLAASSPRSQPTGMPAAKPKGLRAMLEAKADEMGIR